MWRYCLRILPRFALTGLLVAAGIPAFAAGAAGPETSITPFTSPSFERDIRGYVKSMNLGVGGRELGSAETFFGVDSPDGSDQPYLTSGLQWRATPAGQPLLQVSVLQTEGGTPGFGGQTLVHAESQLDLGGRWYLPAIRSEITQVGGAGAALANAGGCAARFGLTGSLGRANYTLDYFRTSARFSALGSTLAPGDSGLDLSSRYALGDAWQLTSRLSLHQAPAEDRNAIAVQRWAIQKKPRLTDIGSPWRLSARFGGVDGDGRHRPVAIELAAQTSRWRSWRINSALGWYAWGATAPDNLPVDGTMWRVSASRGLDISGLRTEISPGFSVGGSRYPNRALASRTSLSLGFPSLGRNLSVSVNYLTAGWGPRFARDDVQLSLNYTQSTAGILSALSPLFSRPRLPWEPRY